VKDSTKVKVLGYDNFNWVSRAWEVSSEHGDITHDEVSAILFVTHIPEGPDALTAPQYTDLRRFEECTGGRHKIPADEALEAIIPNSEDQMEFRKNAVLHVARILGDEVKIFADFLPDLPKIEDPRAMPARKTEEYYLPTFDQEQGSTRGNMIVLEHYWLETLAVPKSVFEDTSFSILGDRLTTAHDRAAQDQRLVDRSPHKVDRLQSFRMISGVMHICMNMIQNMGRNTFGGTNRDAVSMDTLRGVVPNRSALNTKKIDFYGWLRFMDAILRALTLAAAMASLDLTTTKQLDEHQLSRSEFMSLTEKIVDSFLLPSIDRLEADDVKKLPGQTESGHAVLLFHDLMTMHETRHSIKHGHPERLKRMLKYYIPMFYGGGSYNYSNELMEILHNMEHDWPPECANITFDGMLVNTTGKEAAFTEGDIRVEQMNDSIKEKAHGVNASPEYLEKITPALGVLHHLTEHIYADLGVEEINSLHAKVKQHVDVRGYVDHLVDYKIFHWESDTASNHAVIDLYRNGLPRLAGPEGGHAKHLIRHKNRLRKRDDNDSGSPTVDRQELMFADRELVDAIDFIPADHTIAEEPRVDAEEIEDDEEDE
jgi:hypothetical protein